MTNRLGVWQERQARRTILRLGAAGLASAAFGRFAAAQTLPENGSPTKFQIACMTLPYNQYPL